MPKVAPVAFGSLGARKRRASPPAPKRKRTYMVASPKVANRPASGFGDGLPRGAMKFNQGVMFMMGRVGVDSLEG